MTETTATPFPFLFYDKREINVNTLGKPVPANKKEKASRVKIF